MSNAFSHEAATGCLFCLIAQRERPAQIVLDEPGALGFLDIHPLFPGHVLVIPRDHGETLTDLAPELVGAFFAATQRTAAAVQAAVAADGTFIAINNRVSQSVPHLHVHVVPRRHRDGLRGFMWPRQRYPDDNAMAVIADAIRAELAAH